MMWRKNCEVNGAWKKFADIRRGSNGNPLTAAEYGDHCDYSGYDSVKPWSDERDFYDGNILQSNEKSTHANPVLIFCQNKNNKKTDMRKIVSFFQNILAFTLKFMLQR